MDTTFLSYLLAFCLIIILIVYLYQITDGNKVNKEVSKKIKQNNSLIHALIYNKINKDKLIKDNNNQSTCMPIHPVGPVYNFHQSFGKYKNMPCVGSPTGIPQMGWRNFYLSNFTQNEVVEEDPFAEIPTRNFLDNLENVKNIYREEC